MPTLTQILESLGVKDPNKATPEQWEEASRILREQQKERWDSERKAWGFKGETPEEQRKIDEATGPVIKRGEGGEGGKGGEGGEAKG